jgi:hypothetical protein
VGSFLHLENCFPFASRYIAGRVPGSRLKSAALLFHHYDGAASAAFTPLAVYLSQGRWLSSHKKLLAKDIKKWNQMPLTGV